MALGLGAVGAQPATVPTIKPVVTHSTYSVNKDVVDPEYKQSLDCNIRANLAQHAQTIIQDVVPRVNQEINALTSPQKNQNGEWVQVAESINAGDLYHVHVRIPLHKRDGGNRGLYSDITDSSQYHLLYHSWEAGELFRAKWMDELSSVDDSSIQDWVEQQREIITAHQALHSYSSFTKFPAPLSDERRETILDVWYALLTQRRASAVADSEWSKERLRAKLRYLDQGDRTFPEQITQSRNVISTNDRFDIVPTSADHKNFAQPANIFFDERDADPRIAELIAQAEARGFTYLVNPSNPHINFQMVQTSNWKTNDILVAAIRAAALSSSDPYYTFKKVFAHDFEFESHAIFTWDDKYFYTIYYGLNCEENLVMSSIATDVH